MRIFSKRTLREYWERHPLAAGPLRAWYNWVKKQDWGTPDSVKRQFRRASILSDDRVVFRIKGDDYRLVVRIFYPGREVYIRFVGTHAEYDRIDAQEV